MTKLSITAGHKTIMRELSKRSGKSLESLVELFDLYTGILTTHLDKGNKIKLKNIGAVKVVQGAAKVGRNLKTGERIDIPPTKRLKIQMCPVLRHKFRG